MIIQFETLRLNILHSWIEEKTPNNISPHSNFIFTSDSYASSPKKILSTLLSGCGWCSSQLAATVPKSLDLP